MTIEVKPKEQIMTTIDRLTIEAKDHDAAEAFRAAAFGTDIPIRFRPALAPSSGFRGFTLGLDVAGPDAVDRAFARVLAAGATEVRPPKKQFWGGYSGVLRSADGTVWKIATDGKSDAGTADDTIERVVLLLGVNDVKAT